MADLSLFDVGAPCGSARCYSDGLATEPHTCPFAEEIHDDHETLCTCCDDCSQECADSI